MKPSIITSEQVTAIAKSLVNNYKSLRAIKENCYKSLVSKYEREGAKSIIKAAQSIINESVDNKVVTAWSHVSVDNILKVAFRGLVKGGKSGEFAALAKTVEQSYTDVMDFVARCYPYTIDGQPARKVTYIEETHGTKEYEYECIFDVYEVITITPENAVKILKSAHVNQGRIAKRRLVKGVGVCTTTQVKSRHEVARYRIDRDEEGRIVKGDKIEVDYTLPVVRLDEYRTLSEVNKALAKSEK